MIAAGTLALLAGCTSVSGKADVTTTGAGTTKADKSSVVSDPLAPADQAFDQAGCLELAKGPWADHPHGPDPIGLLRAGKLPPFDNYAEASHIRVFHSPEEYDDPSTLDHPAEVRKAMRAAGFREAAEVRWGEDDENFRAITMIQYRDAKGAKAALSTHVASLCGRAITTTVVDGGNGLQILRESGAVRRMTVTGDLVVSEFACVCSAPSDSERQAGVDSWAHQVQELLDQGLPGSSTR